MQFVLALLGMAITADAQHHIIKQEYVGYKLIEPPKVLADAENSSEISQQEEDPSGLLSEITEGESEFTDSTNSTEPTPAPDQKIPLAVGLSCLGIIIIVIVVVSIVLKKKQGNAPYDPTVDLGLVENEVI